MRLGQSRGRAPAPPAGGPQRAAPHPPPPPPGGAEPRARLGRERGRHLAAGHEHRAQRRGRLARPAGGCDELLEKCDAGVRDALQRQRPDQRERVFGRAGEAYEAADRQREQRRNHAKGGEGGQAEAARCAALAAPDQGMRDQAPDQRRRVAGRLRLPRGARRQDDAEVLAIGHRPGERGIDLRRHGEPVVGDADRAHARVRLLRRINQQSIDPQPGVGERGSGEHGSRGDPAKLEGQDQADVVDWVADLDGDGAALSQTFAP